MKSTFVAFTFLTVFELAFGLLSPNEVKSILSTSTTVKDIGNPDFKLKNEHSTGILRAVPLLNVEEWQAVVNEDHQIVDGLAFHYWDAVSKYANLTFEVSKILRFIFGIFYMYSFRWLSLLNLEFRMA